jgi:RHS repeat-associated protein
LKSNGLILGPSYLQPVELGELIQVDVESFYREETDPGTPQTLLQIFGSMLVNLGLQGQGVIPAGEQGLDVFSDGSSAVSQGLYSFLEGSVTELVSTKPQSYLVYMFLGENLKINSAYSGIVQVGEPGTMQHLQMLERTMPYKGYFYTFVTNQSAHRVYYNNLKITRQRGTLRAMNNYYPFGLMWDNPDAMPNATYQGKEFQTNIFSDGSELALYDFGARMYDPVLGRWHCSDPMYQFDSPYNAMANHPVVNIDPDGMWSIPWGNIMSSIGGCIAAIKETTTQLIGYADFVNGDTQAIFSSSTSHPLSNLGQGLQVAGTLLQAFKDGKMIKDAAGGNTKYLKDASNFQSQIHSDGFELESGTVKINEFIGRSDLDYNYHAVGVEFTFSPNDPNTVPDYANSKYRWVQTIVTNESINDNYEPYDAPLGVDAAILDISDRHSQLTSVTYNDGQMKLSDILMRKGNDSYDVQFFAETSLIRIDENGDYSSTEISIRWGMTIDTSGRATFLKPANYSLVSQFHQKMLELNPKERVVEISQK